MTNREAFKKLLPKYMSKVNMNQRELAKAVCMSESTVHCWLTGKAFPRIDVIQRIADVLGCSTDDLLVTQTPALALSDYSTTVSPEVIEMLDASIQASETKRQIRDRERQNELELIKIYDSLTPEGKKYLLQQAEIAKTLFKTK